MISKDSITFEFNGVDTIRADLRLSGHQFCECNPESQEQAKQELLRSAMTLIYGDARMAFRELYAALCMMQHMGQPVLDDPAVKAAMEKLYAATPADC